MQEVYCPYLNAICPTTCPNFSKNEAGMQNQLQGYVIDLDDVTIWSRIFPGHNQQTKAANVREMRKQNCEALNANKLFGKQQ